MNYLKVYCNLIRKAENRTPPEGYTEKHHTFPKSIYGKNNRLVVLTAREHYIAHALLERIYMKRYGLKDQRTIKMTYAHLAMKCNSGYVNSHLYEGAKIRFIENNPSRRPEIKEKQKLGLIRSWKDENRRKEFRENNPSHRPEVKEKQRKAALERWNKKGAREKIMGTNNHFYGKKHTEETKNKIIENNKKHFIGKNNPNSKTWKITFECGRIVIVECLTAWAKENGYKYHNLSNVKQGLSKNHKGIIKIEVYETF
jgi:hypothetical protein